MNDFSDSRFMTAEEKLLTLQQWHAFLRSGLQAQHFTERVYTHLTLHCSFIAHFSRQGFWAHYFAPGNEKNALGFIGQFDPNGDHQAVELGASWWYGDAEYQDLNEAMCQAMGEYQEALREAIEARGRDEAIRQALGILGGWGLTAQPVSIRPKGGGQR